jgi:hypothetical protein
MSALIAARRAVVTVDFLQRLAVPNQDPIFAAIGAHRAATAGVLAIVEAHDALETELPKNKRRSNITICGEEIVESDDPRWIDCERAVILAWKVQDEAAVALLNVRPTTLAGVTALLRYAVEANVDDQVWPAEPLTDDAGNQRSWHQFLVESVAAAISNCVKETVTA